MRALSLTAYPGQVFELGASTGLRVGICFAEKLIVGNTGILPVGCFEEGYCADSTGQIISFHSPLADKQAPLRHKAVCVRTVPSQGWMEVRYADLRAAQSLLGKLR